MADRVLPHIVLDGVSSVKEFKGRSGRGSPRPSPVQNRQTHAQRLVAALDAIPVAETAKSTYLAVEGRPGEPLIADKFNVSGLSLLSTQNADIDQQIAGRAIVKADRSTGGIANLKSKLNQFAGELRPPNKKGVRNPYNADLANSVGMFAEIELRDLWRHPTKPFPQSADPIAWEVWLEPAEVDGFVAMAAQQGMTVYPDRLEFPEDTVVLVEGTTDQMATTTVRTGSVRAVSPPGEVLPGNWTLTGATI
ncbi:hypothetical protein [Jannaschia marina]|uniref:hypothetical protein n=1 Tax=Jannaschia marina TaxID=2741674 RepID=UPI0015C9C1F5|nr:hypothetical protein [Jannaschia marina]